MKKSNTPARLKEAYYKQYVIENYIRYIFKKYSITVDTKCVKEVVRDIAEFCAEEIREKTIEDCINSIPKLRPGEDHLDAGHESAHSHINNLHRDWNRRQQKKIPDLYHQKNYV
jgi:hypothetical protein